MFIVKYSNLQKVITELRCFLYVTANTPVPSYMANRVRSDSEKHLQKVIGSNENIKTKH